MNRNIFKLFIYVTLTNILYASGWKIPEQSADSVALSGSYIANAKNAESSYYNPANMSFNPNVNQVNMSIMGIHLSSINYTDDRSNTLNGNSKTENFIIPTIFYSSKNYDGIRYGISLTAPGGLAKRWDETYAKTFAEEFSLRIIELNPVISYRLSENLSLAAGVRMIYSDGVVKSDGEISGFELKRDMTGDALEYGYNLALAYKFNNNSNLSMTYRSNVNLKEEGKAKLYINGFKSYDGGANVKIPLPASFNIAYAHTFDKTTIEFVYEKTFWSKYNSLDFEYDDSITNPILKAVFDNPSNKNWSDTIAKRIGITHQYSDKLKLMFGFAIDESAAPNNTLSFELPDTDAKIYSLGYEYKLSEDTSYSLGYLYNQKEAIKVSNDTLVGTVSDATAHILSFSYKMKF